MVIFILIFFATVVIVGAASVLGFSFYLKRRSKSLETNNEKQFADASPQYRSLFEPDDGEIRALEREEKSKAESAELETARLISFEKVERLKEVQAIWLENPNRKNTIELLSSAAQSQSAETFGDAAENVIKVWRRNKIKNLNARDLADLLDSHLAILPQQERASGAIFWLKKEIADLRRAAES